MTKLKSLVSPESSKYVVISGVEFSKSDLNALTELADMFGVEVSGLMDEKQAIIWCTDKHNPISVGGVVKAYVLNDRSLDHISTRIREVVECRSRGMTYDNWNRRFARLDAILKAPSKVYNAGTVEIGSLSHWGGGLMGDNTAIIQIRDLNGNWRDVRQIDSMGDQHLIQEMQDIQNQYQGKRTRAVDKNRRLLDIL